ncbi:hypothetical protein EVAR_103597_1 [Eumeta japonica]|uniref:Uncharacterized protein n=1 Tax=Eumeta variegata TaxID=151549 RepID=A0A4C1ZBJ4_EUMVA|nr:hypothetical protein EVAR_103597_1 [Eumeta japonica]
MNLLGRPVSESSGGLPNILSSNFRPSDVLLLLKRPAMHGASSEMGNVSKGRECCKKYLRDRRRAGRRPPVGISSGWRSRPIISSGGVRRRHKDLVRSAYDADGLPVPPGGAIQGVSYQRKVVTATHGHSQRQRSHKCFTSVLGRNSISDGEANTLMKRKCGDKSGSVVMEKEVDRC